MIIMADLQTKVKVLQAANTLKDNVIAEKNEILKDKEELIKKSSNRRSEV